MIVRHDGRASDIRVVSSLDPELDEAAVHAVEQWRFEPGRLGAVAVDVMALADVDFSIR
jgi:TonB family protein